MAEVQGLNLLNKTVNSTLDTAGDKLGTYYLADNPKYYELQRSNNFIFFIVNIINSIRIIT